jgi:hypothetical protein
VADGARSAALKNSRADFLENELPQILRRMELLGLDPKDYFK